MARQITIITPENIPLTLEPAGLATRFGALLVDLALQGALALLLFLIALAFSALGFSANSLVGLGIGQGLAGSILTAIFILLGFAIFSGYFILFENIWNGQTPGKRVFNLRVVRDSGAPVDFGAVAARNFVRIADMLPISYALGALTMFFNPGYKRLGDIVAGTVVIKERHGTNLPALRFSRDKSAVALPVAPLPDGTLNPYEILTIEELALLRQFATRRWQMTSDDSERLAYRLVAPLVTRLNIVFQDGVPPRYADLVTALVTVADETERERQL